MKVIKKKDLTLQDLKEKNLIMKEGQNQEREKVSIDLTEVTLEIKELLNSESQESIESRENQENKQESLERESLERESLESKENSNPENTTEINKWMSIESEDLIMDIEVDIEAEAIEEAIDPDTIGIKTKEAITKEVVAATTEIVIQEGKTM